MTTVIAAVCGLIIAFVLLVLIDFGIFYATTRIDEQVESDMEKLVPEYGRRKQADRVKRIIMEDE